MRLTKQALLTYQGFHGTRGVCHVRVYEQPGRLPVVIAGALDDGPGTTTTNAIEMVAAAIQAEFFGDGREFELVEHWPDTIDCQGLPTFMRVHLGHRSIEEDPGDPRHFAGSVVSIDGDEIQVERGCPIQGDFRAPHWEPIVDLRGLLGCAVRVWAPGDYTARAVAGEPGQEMRDEAAKRSRAAVDRWVP